MIPNSVKKSLHTVAEDLRRGRTVDDIQLIIKTLESCIEKINPPGQRLGAAATDEEEEYTGYIQEAIDILKIVRKGRKNIKVELMNYLNGLLWDNFIDDETKAAYTLGSMFWNKMIWIEAGCKNKFVSDIASNLALHIKELFDHLENFANEK